MLKRLAVLFCLSSLACGGGDALPTGAVSGGDPRDGGVTAAAVVAAPAPPPATTEVAGITATFDRGICYVTNRTANGAAIRYRVSRVVDETDPANYSKQIKVVDETTTVPPGVKDFAVVGMKTPDICGGLFQYDCGRGDGLLAYQFIRHYNVCPTPSPTPTPTPSPTPTPPPPPCKKSYKGEFQVTYLSNSGNGYKIKDDGTTWLTVDLKSGKQDTRFEHAVDGSNLCLYWGNEKIGCAKAQCSDTRETWHGNVGFACTEVCK